MVVDGITMVKIKIYQKKKKKEDSKIFFLIN